jgi:hypothetical protein
MKYLLAILTLVLVACQACGARPDAGTKVVVTHDQPKVALQFHADVEFTLAERAVIAQAVSDLEYQTAGLYRLGVTYDLDFQAGVEKWESGPWLVRAESTYPWIQMVEWQRGEILGLTMRDDEHHANPPRCYLVIDRLADPLRLRHVAMHELLHAAGLDDLGPSGSVMSGASPSDERPVLCLSPADQAETCRVFGCKVQELNGCEWQ